MRLPVLAYDDAGLAPAVVQDARSGRVLMLGYVNEEALAATVRTGWVHFWSRSRSRLWCKGETSSNRLEVVALRADCDGDALLVSARPAGPTCHTGAASCFDDPAAPPIPAQGFADLEALWNVVARRAVARPAGSYTASLLEGGVDSVGRKVLEEAGELLLAAKDDAAGTGRDGRVAEEAADLVYHLLVLLAERRVEPADVIDELAGRRR